MMRQLQIEAPGQVSWREVPLPEPGAGEVRMRVLGVTTCPHWDLHILGGKPMFPGQTITYPYLPGQPGHEAMGEVDAVGDGVTSLAIGDRVVAWRDTGKPRMGFYGQFNTFAEEDLLRIPRDLSPVRVASLELAMCVQVVFQHLERFGGIAGCRVGVCGLGPAGLVAVQLARAHGARTIVGLDPLAQRRELAARLGANDVLAPDGKLWPASRDHARSLDVAIDCTGLSGAVEFLLDRTRQAVALFGVLREDIRYAPRHMWGPGVSLIGYGDHNRAAAETALAHILAGRLDLEALVTKTLPMSAYVDGVALLKDQKAIKILFDPWA
jgi:threonine dehydrogenase-like Zn-dependent dehydrogenase